MDIYCPKCAEPWDVFELHETELPFDQARKVFFTQGCGLLFNEKLCESSDDPRGEMSALMADLLGDDVDGIASMMEDAEYLGMFE